MAVYMIRAGDDGPIKIGSSKDPVFRMQTFQIAHYLTLKIIRIVEGGSVEEFVLHKRFAHLLIQGEWFKPDPELFGDIGLPETTVEAVMAKLAPRQVEVPPGFDKNMYRAAVRIWRERGASLSPVDSILDAYQKIVTASGVAEQLPMVAIHD